MQSDASTCPLLYVSASDSKFVSNVLAEEVHCILRLEPILSSNTNGLSRPNNSRSVQSTSLFVRPVTGTAREDLNAECTWIQSVAATDGAESNADDAGVVVVVAADGEAAGCALAYIACELNIISVPEEEGFCNTRVGDHVAWEVSAAGVVDVLESN